MSGPLQGVRVADFSRVLSGPYATMVLGDLGADVIKVERPGSGDETRGWGPPFAGGESAYYLSVNRNKRSVALDLAREDHRGVAMRLIESSQIVVENFRPGTMDRFGLGYDAIAARNPRAVVCSISGFGLDGPDRDRPGYDFVVQGMGGVMSITGEPDGPPQKVGVAIADIMAGMYATTAILAALKARERTGRGQHVDVPLYDSQVAWLANQALNYLVSGEVPRRLGTAHPNIVPYQAFETRDGHLMLAVGTDRQFRSCCEALNLASLADRPEYASNAARVAHRDELVSLLAERFRQHDTAHWIEALQRSRVPAGPINDLSQVLSGPYAEARELVRSLPHASAGRVPTVANPVCFSETPVEYRCAPPVLGQDTLPVLRELGFDDAEIDELRQAGVI